MRSASEIVPAPELNSCRIRSSVSSAGPTPELTSQLRCGSSRILAPLAPPRRSVPRKLDAAAQAVVTSCGTDSPESRTFAFSAAMSASPTRSWSTAGTGSCHSCGSGTHGPR